MNNAVREQRKSFKNNYFALTSTLLILLCFAISAFRNNPIPENISISRVDTFPNNQSVSNASTLYHLKGGVTGDKGTIITPNDTTNSPATSYFGALTVLPSDTAMQYPPIYMSNGSYWIPIASGTNIKDTIYTQLPLYSFYNSNGKQVLAIQQADGIIGSCPIIWDSLLVFSAPPCAAQIGGKVYFSPATTMTLDSADATNPRQDLFVFDSTGIVTFLTGTPAPEPIPPAIDPASQIALTTGITIAAGATTPSGIVATLIYDEGLNLPDEWDGVAQNTISANFTDASNPYHGSKDIYVSSYQSGAQIYFSAGAEQTFHNGDIINFHIYTNGTFNNTLYGYFADSDKLVTNYLHINSTYGFNPNNGNTYQNISIPLSAFQWTNNGQYKIFELELAGNDTTGTAGFFMDYFTIQQGIPNIPPTTGSDSVHGFIQAPDSSYLGVRRENGLVDTLEVLNTGAYGAVASVGLSMPDVIFNSSVTNSPITTEGTLTPTLKNQSAYTVLGNHTSGSATPTFGKLPINSINATGTPSSSNFLNGAGAWVSGILSPWVVSGSNIYYNSGNVGINNLSPSTFLEISDSTSYATLTPPVGLRLSNNRISTGSIYNPPSLSFLYHRYVGGNDIYTEARLYAKNNVFYLGIGDTDSISKSVTFTNNGLGIAMSAYSLSLGPNSSSSLTATGVVAANGILAGASSGIPDASAILEIKGEKGYLPPRVTSATRDLIPSPAIGLSLYNTDLKQPQYNDGVTWKSQVGMTFGTAAPSITPAAIGNFFLDTTNKKLYISTGTTSPSDWNILN